ncbi:MAG: hypothetical protein ACJA13_002043 [Paraglaciecola sp.]|jgi:hypothetical protein
MKKTALIWGGYCVLHPMLIRLLLSPDIKPYRERVPCPFLPASTAFLAK